jgi:dolichol-phosphate mannosyltransferase
VFRTSFKYVAAHAVDSDIMVTMDADNTHNPFTINSILKKINNGADVVVASCFAKKGRLLGVPLRRILLTFLCNGLYSILFPIAGTREYTGFYRGYRAGVIKQALARYGDCFVRSAGFAVMAEFLLVLRRRGYRIEEVPMVVRYDLKGEKSKLKLIPTVREHIKVIFSQWSFKEKP